MYAGLNVTLCPAAVRHVFTCLLPNFPFDCSLHRSRCKSILVYGETRGEIVAGDEWDACRSMCISVRASVDVESPKSIYIPVNIFKRDILKERHSERGEESSSSPLPYQHIFAALTNTVSGIEILVLSSLIFSLLNIYHVLLELYLIISHFAERKGGNQRVLPWRIGSCESRVAAHLRKGHFPACINRSSRINQLLEGTLNGAFIKMSGVNKAVCATRGAMSRLTTIPHFVLFLQLYARSAHIRLNNVSLHLARRNSRLYL